MNAAYIYIYTHTPVSTTIMAMPCGKLSDCMGHSCIGGIVKEILETIRAVFNHNNYRNGRMKTENAQ